MCVLTAAQLSRDGSVGGADEATASPLVNPKEQEVVDKKILDNQYKCFERMNREPQYNKSGGGSGSFQEGGGVVFVLFCFVSEGSLVCFLVMLQVFTAAATGTAGCAGTTLRQEPPPPRTAQIILRILTPQVSPPAPKTAVCQLFDTQVCPTHLLSSSPSEKATKYCGEDGQWFRHPETNRTWSNYTLCNENTSFKLKVGSPQRHSNSN